MSRPDRPATPSTRPATRPTPARPGSRPSPGDVGDFLGFDKPLRPAGGDFATTRPARPGAERPTTLPGVVDRPNRPVRPGVEDRPDRPGGARPGSNRPNFGDGWNTNNVINKRPVWANVDNSKNVTIHRRWNDALVRPGWRVPGSARRGYWNGWADGVRHDWSHYHHHGGWYNDSWWRAHPHGLCGWHYHYGSHNRGWYYWWTAPTWTTASSWFTWSTPASVWDQPVYYDYGSGGNVTYQDNSVYVGGTQVASAQEFAQSAMDLATVEPPATQEEAAEAEWLPLGTFAVSTDERDTEPTMTVQLAVDKEGVVAGTLYNIATDEATSVQGAVDRETQRVAIRFGESETVVAETGLYNLTQTEAPVLVHFGDERTENYLLVRLDAPEPAPAADDSSDVR